MFICIRSYLFTHNFSDPHSRFFFVPINSFTGFSNFACTTQDLKLAGLPRFFKTSCSSTVEAYRKTDYCIACGYCRLNSQTYSVMWYFALHILHCQRLCNITKHHNNDASNDTSLRFGSLYSYSSHILSVVKLVSLHFAALLDGRVNFWPILVSTTYWLNIYRQFSLIASYLFACKLLKQAHLYCAF